MKNFVIFLSSTFRDMHAGARLSPGLIFPELSEKLEQLGGRLDVVDLRWGVQTENLDDLEERNSHVLQVCLDEIQRAQPLFVALVGDRFGWVPPLTLLAAVDPRLAEVCPPEIKQSITAPRDPSWTVDTLRAGDCARLRVLARALAVSGHPEHAARRYSDAASGNSESSGLLQQLKLELAETIPDRVRHYRASYEEKSDSLIALDELGEQIRADLWREITSLLAPEFGKSPDPEATLADRFGKLLMEPLLPRTELVSRLMAFCVAPEPSGAALVLHGPGGSGKSVVLALLARELAKNRDSPATITNVNNEAAGFHGVEALKDLRAQLEGILPKHARDELADEGGNGNENVRKLFIDASHAGRLVVILDGIEELSDDAERSSIGWLPAILPDNVRVIIATASTKTLRGLRVRYQSSEVAIPPLDRQQAGELIAGICTQNRRTLPAPLIDAFLEIATTEGDRGHESPLWLSIATQQLNQLDIDAFSTGGASRWRSSAEPEPIAASND